MPPQVQPCSGSLVVVPLQAGVGRLSLAAGCRMTRTVSHCVRGGVGGFQDEQHLCSLKGPRRYGPVSVSNSEAKRGIESGQIVIVGRTQDGRSHAAAVGGLRSEQSLCLCV